MEAPQRNGDKMFEVEVASTFWKREGMPRNTRCSPSWTRWENVRAQPRGGGITDYPDVKCDKRDFGGM